MPKVEAFLFFLEKKLSRDQVRDGCMIVHTPASTGMKKKFHQITDQLLLDVL